MKIFYLKFKIFNNLINSLYLLVKSFFFIPVIKKIIRIIYLISENRDFNCYTNGEYWLLKQLQNNIVFFYCGANDAKIFNGSVFLKKKISEIHLFEINKKLKTKLKKNLQGYNSNINFLGLSNKKQTKKFYLSDNSQISSVNKEWLDNFQVKKNKYYYESIKCISLDSYIIKNNIGFIDFIKIDVEGSEFKILKGLTKSLQKKNIGLIQFEYHYSSIISKSFLYDYFKFFQLFGYEIGKLYPNKVVHYKHYDFREDNLLGPNLVAFNPVYIKEKKIKLF